MGRGLGPAREVGLTGIGQLAVAEESRSLGEGLEQWPEQATEEDEEIRAA